MNTFGWHANISSTDRLMRWQTLWFYQNLPQGGSRVIVGFSEDGQAAYEEVPDGMEPNGTGIILPYGCLDALTPLLRPGPSEDMLTELRGNLLKEEGRVDRVMDTWLKDLDD